jgi:hypothetical protein|tara:strand:+ start:3988 stop:4095 length:108 start_codon:yes stop_codon:yes gene_type:complete
MNKHPSSRKSLPKEEPKADEPKLVVDFDASGNVVL